MKIAMKMNNLKYSLLLAVCLLAVEVTGAEARKEINKQYEVNSTTLLDILNSFGKVNVYTWEKPMIEVTVEVIGRASSESRAQKMVDRIEIDIDESSSAIRFTTELNNLKSSGNDRFEVNYEVRMPKINPLKLEHSFGDAYVGDRTGETEIELSYGSLKADDLLTESFVKVSFGKGEIGRFQSGDVEVKDSKRRIESTEKIDLEQHFSDVEIEEIGEMELESRYGSVEFGQVGILEGDAKYSGFSIDELNGSLDLETEYASGFEIGRVTASFNDISILSKFSSIRIRLDADVKANIDAEFSYSDLDYDYLDIEFQKRIKDDQDRMYLGTINGGDDGKRINIRSRYGNVRLSN
jgi:hypothetical protein